MTVTKERDMQLHIAPESLPTKQSPVFYNPDMQCNRDISTSCIRIASYDSSTPWHIGDLLAGTGIRAMRYVTENDMIAHAYVNDINPHAIENCKTNIRINDIPSNKLTVTQQDANELMHEHRYSWQYVDIDPFGTPRPYLDAAAAALTKSGTLGITATDLAVLCGSYPKTCLRRYAATPVKTQFCHEIALRILIKSVFQNCAHRDKCFTPLLCWHEGHYIRVFGQVLHSAKQTNKQLANIGYLIYCPHCLYRSLAETYTILCPHCSQNTDVAGPLWIGRFADGEFAQAVTDDLEKQEYTKAAELVSTIANECSIRQPYYNTHQLAKYAKTNAVKRQSFIEHIRQQGYQCTPTHFSPVGIRTNCHLDQLYKSMRSI